MREGRREGRGIELKIELMFPQKRPEGSPVVEGVIGADERQRNVAGFPVGGEERGVLDAFGRRDIGRL